MAKNISISDDVYEALKREKGDRSFSEVIDAKLRAGGTLKEVHGQEIFDEETMEQVSTAISRSSAGTMERLTDEDL